jgi:hypothetical protein
LANEPLLANALAHAKDIKFDREGINAADAPVKEIINQYLFFVGRYELHLDEAPVHASETCIVVRGTDHNVTEEYTACFDNCLLLSSPIGVTEINISQFTKLAQSFGLYSSQTTDEKTLEAINSDWRKFSHHDMGSEVHVSQAQFIEFCKVFVGTKRRIVIKFMKNPVSNNTEGTLVRFFCMYIHGIIGNLFILHMFMYLQCEYITYM